MRLLAFDTSGASVSAAAAEGSDLVAHRREPLLRGHAERLLPLLRELLSQAGWTWREIGLVAVTLGPGNFTGLRAGISVARALALSLPCPAIGVSALELTAVAAAAANPSDDSPIQVVLDARRGEAYAQLFSGELGALSEPALSSLSNLANGVPSGCRLAGSAAATLGRLLQCGNRVIEAEPDARYLVGAAWRWRDRGAAIEAGTALRPLYLRSPDAQPGAGASLLPAQV